MVAILNSRKANSPPPKKSSGSVRSTKNHKNLVAILLLVLKIRKSKLFTVLAPVMRLVKRLIPSAKNHRVKFAAPKVNEKILNLKKALKFNEKAYFLKPKIFLKISGTANLTRYLENSSFRHILAKNRLFYYFLIF